MSKKIKQLKNLIRKLKTTGFGHLFGSSVINKILTFMSSIILVRLIPKSDYGIYSNADNILGMFIKRYLDKGNLSELDRKTLYYGAKALIDAMEDRQ